jgi:hypothetical protein
MKQSSVVSRRSSVGTKAAVLAVLALALALFAPRAVAQDEHSPVRQGSSLPVTCTPTGGDAYRKVFYKTTAPIGWYACTATNTWTASAGGGGVSTLDSVTDPAASRAFTMGTFRLNFNFTGTWTTTGGFSVSSSASNASTQPLVLISSGASTTHDVFQACALGTTNCAKFTSAGLFTTAGTAAIDGTKLSGTIPAAVLPALTGAVTSSAGSVATSPGKADALQSGSFCADAGANDTYACNLSPAITAYVTGTTYRFKANTANTGAATVNLNSVGALTIKKKTSGITTDLADNDIRAGAWVVVVYDGTNAQCVGGCDGNAAAGGGGGITNSAGNNIIPKSDGTNIGASSMTDNGTSISTAEYFQASGGFGNSGSPPSTQGLSFSGGDTVVRATTGSHVYLQNQAGTTFADFTAAGVTIPGATALAPLTAAGGDIGSATLPFEYLFLAGSSGTPGTNNFKIQGASTSGTRTVDLPDANTKVPIVSQVVTISGPTAARTYTFPDANKTMMATDTGVVAGQMPALTGAVTSSSGAVATSPGKLDVATSNGYCADAGVNDTYACNLSPAVTAYVAGTHYRFKANTANTGAASINFNSVGALTIVKLAGGVTTTLADNDIRAGQMVECVYDGTNCQMMSQVGNAASGGGGTVNIVAQTLHSSGAFPGTNIYSLCSNNDIGIGPLVTCIVPATGMLKNLYLYYNAGSGFGTGVPASATYTFTVQWCAASSSPGCTPADTGITCAMTAGVFGCNDTTHTQAVTVGDIMVLKEVGSGGTPVQAAVTSAIQVQ